MRKKRRNAVKKWILSVCNEKQIKAEEDEKIRVAVTTQVFSGWEGGMETLRSFVIQKEALGRRWGLDCWHSGGLQLAKNYLRVSDRYRTTLVLHHRLQVSSLSLSS